MSEFDDLVADLKQKRDELRLKMHLASKEAQDEWEELEEKMQEFSSRAQLGKTSEGLGERIPEVCAASGSTLARRGEEESARCGEAAPSTGPAAVPRPGPFEAPNRFELGLTPMEDEIHPVNPRIASRKD